MKKSPVSHTGRADKSRIVRTLSKTGAGKRVVSGKKNGKSGGVDTSFWLSVLWVFFVSGFLGTAAYVLFFSPLLRVKSVAVDGLESLDRRSVISVASGVMDQNYFDILDGSNLILASRSRIEEALLGRFKKIESVAISKRFPDKLSISVRERGSALVFCGGSDCYVIDRNGRAYAQADFQSNELDERGLIILRDLSRENISMADASVETGLVDFLKKVESRLDGDLSIGTKQEWSTPALISGDLRAETAEGWKIYFNYAISADKEIEMLKTVLDNSLDKVSRADLEYIDLRLDNKVYYKLKSAPVAEEQQDEEQEIPAVKETEKKKKK
ncbi:MAG: FtsQ-type POTRA domain-containing protein [Candidatus Moranbacteria bacterium]|nr:FtsQ-type POTRA domain-containing protein [Candidatus Moranbacteria bacterium]